MLRMTLITSFFAITLTAFGWLDFQSIDLTPANDMYGESSTREFIKKKESQWLSEGRSSDEPVYGDITLVGQVPRIYLDSSDTVGTKLGMVRIEDGIIAEVREVREAELAILKKESGTLLLTDDTSSDPNGWDVIYPGLIDLHNHPKQNNLPTWDLALGQFKNRFEWSKWTEYKKSVSSNVNPWVNSHPAATCSAFRWSELQAMILGTTYMQGFVSTSCVKHFAIHRVEDPNAYRYKDDDHRELSVSAPSFIIDPDAFKVVWNLIRPEMLEMAGIAGDADADINQKIANVEKLTAKGTSFREATYRVVMKLCPNMKDSGLKGGTAEEDIDIMTDRDTLEAHCPGSELTKDLITYLYRHHGSVIGKQDFLAHERTSAVVAHVSEGRHDDYYNRLEFPMLQMMGMAKKGMNLVHALGVSRSGYEYMADNGMGVVWSPYSNLLLYGETLDLKLLADINHGRRNRLLIALGSDWVPTGSKSVLEEVKLAYQYIERQERLTGEPLTDIYDDKELFKMMTEYPAKMIGHYHDDPNEHGIGTIAEGAVGTVIVVKNNYRRNAFTNIVKYAGEGDINLVVVDGKPIYGERTYLDLMGMKENYEVLPKYFADLAKLRPDKSKGGQKLASLISTVESTDERVVHVGKAISGLDLKDKTDKARCAFSGRKAFAYVEVTEGDANRADGVLEFQTLTGGRSGLNLDRASDIQKLLGALMMTQSSNVEEEKYEDMLSYFPSLYSCNDENSKPEPHLERILTFVSGDGHGESELERNKAREDAVYELCGVCNSSGAEKMKKAYGF